MSTSRKRTPKKKPTAEKLVKRTSKKRTAEKLVPLPLGTNVIDEGERIVLRLPAGTFAAFVEELAKTVTIADGMALWGLLTAGSAARSDGAWQPPAAGNGCAALQAVARWHSRRIEIDYKTIEKYRKGPKKRSAESGLEARLNAITAWLAAGKAASQDIERINRHELQKLKTHLQEEGIRIPSDETLRRNIRTAKARM